MANQTYYEDVQEGAELPPLVKGPIRLIDLVKYAGASDDYAEIHFDREVATRNTFPDVILHGMLKTAWLAQMVTHWAGEAATLKSIDCQYRGIDVVGETVTCKGTVTKKEIADGQHLVHCNLWTENTRGERTTRGMATIALPTKKV